MPDFVTRSTCRVCGSTLLPILTLPSVAFPRFPTVPTIDLPTSPLTWCWCPECTLVQLQEKGRPDLLYPEYWYRSGTNELMRAELQEVAGTALSWSADARTAMDIGANDGTLLRAYPLPIHRIAVEPSATFTEDLQSACEVLIPDLFPSAALDPWNGRIDLLTTIAMFYALDDPLAGAAQAARLLSPHGVWIVQFQDLAQMLQQHAVDNICVEHVLYFTLHSLRQILATNGLEIVDCQVTAINGGSLRVVVMHREQARHVPAADLRIQQQLLVEHQLGLLDASEDPPTSLWQFRRDAKQAVTQIRSTIEWFQDFGYGPVDLYGASTKGNTLLHLMYPPGSPVPFRRCWERSPQKVGRFYGPYPIPIVDEAEARQDPPALLVPLIWQFRESLLHREQAYLLGGGTIAFPLPHCELIGERR